MTNYPAQIDNDASLPRVIDLQTPVHGDTVNRLRDAIVAIEGELGPQPASVYTSVRARLDHIENVVTQQVVTLNGDLGGTPASPLVIGLQGRPLSSAAPSVTQVIAWNGLAWAPANSIQLSQDLGNTTLSPFVVGIQGRPISTQAPLAQQVLTWDGYKWLPTTQTITFNLLPTVTLLPVDIVFLGGDGYNGTTTPMRVGARSVDMSNYPSTTLDGRVRTMTFRADLEVTSGAATGVALLKDTSSNAIVMVGTTNTITNASNTAPIQITTQNAHGYTTGQIVAISGVNGNFAANGVFTVTNTGANTFTLNSSIGSGTYTNGGLSCLPLSTSSLSSTELSGVVTSGNFAGVMRTDQVSLYEVQIYILNGSLTDQVICRNARLYVTYTPPINPSGLLALSMPTDINFISGTELNGFSTPAGMGGRLLDITQFPALMPDGSGRQRLIEFFADVEVSAAGVDGYCQLYDTVSNAVVTNTNFHFTNTVATELHSVPLLVGTVPGTIRSDITGRYEVQLWKVSNSVADRVLCNNARITIFYQ
jgi:hypothetical protein